MTQQEKKLNQLENRVCSLEAVFQSFMTEMRDRDNQRAAEVRELRQKQETDIKELRASIDGIGKNVRNLTIAVRVFIVAEVIVMITIEVALIYSILTR